MLVECANCAAPLDVQTNHSSVVCAYCRRKNVVRKTHTLAQVTPTGWKPPPQWMPPPQTALPPQPIPYREPPARSALIVPLIGWGVVALVGASGAFIKMGGFAFPFSKASRWDGAATLVCGVNEHLVLDGKNVELDDVLIEANANCTIEIRNSKLTGRTIVNAGVNGQVTVVDSELRADETAIALGGNSKLQLDNTTVKAKEIGVEASGNNRIDLRKSNILAKETAIKGSANVRVDARESRIEGGDFSLDFKVNGEVTLQDTQVKGEKQMGMMGKLREK